MFSSARIVARWSAAFVLGSAAARTWSAESRPRSPGKPERHEPGVGGRAAVLVDDDVRVPLGDEDVARARVQLQRDLVRHRRGRHEDRRFLAEQRGDPLLQRDDGRVLPLLLVAHGGLRDRRAHARAWAA